MSAIMLGESTFCILHLNATVVGALTIASHTDMIYYLIESAVTQVRMKKLLEQFTIWLYYLHSTLSIHGTEWLIVNISVYYSL